MTAEDHATVLAHVTASRMRAPLDSPTMTRFVMAFDSVSRAARESPGFVWQLETRGQGHPVIDPRDPLGVVSVSTWTDYPELHAFVYRSGHGQALLHRQEWFGPVPQPSTALWWLPADDRPSLADALARLLHLRRYGPSPRAFTLMRRFDRQGRPVARGRGRRGN